MLSLYDTLTHHDRTPQADSLNVYTCGPTVYNYAHIGNLFSYIMASLMVRTLRENGAKVNWAMNLTDIDDKTIKATIAEFGPEANLDNLRTYTGRFTQAFWQDLRLVGIDPDEIEFINATDAIATIFDMVLNLLEQGLAYTADDGSTYFSLKTYQERFGDYGALVGDKFLAGQQLGHRISHDEYDKDELSDFALWKAYDASTDGQIFWDHPVLGRGRPGWHIECSAINRECFHGQVTNIHTGGVDLIFPHHTNEIAQSQPFGKFVEQWMHSAHILVDGQRMGKRFGNFFTIRDLEVKGFSGLDLRYLYFQGHYRHQQNFTWEALQAAKQARTRLATHWEKDGNLDADLRLEMLSVLNEDLNSAKALAAVWSALKARPNDAANIAYTANELLSLGLEHVDLQSGQDLIAPEQIVQMMREREQARAEKNFGLADELRDKILAEGWEIIDTSEGAKLQAKV